ncbi:GDP-mannose 4,6-dehydratase [Vibrio sp. JC009]|uniref:GDP-mannose 4,6-dehydratase n=1 Tax=Vibrio sp. JC009 TaxID=2912314 RepID=UPI0023B0FCFA|nr:GDP-mannose 4,6-dehydratase [Vibrio sp. JC009]WED22011.1 GDP-mannose 4,6-dehydratase [Vibrio sp. JC009]
MKKVLVTGADGFTGKYVSNLLASKGYQVVKSGIACDNSRGIVACDLTKYSDILNLLNDTQPDGIIHLAALSFVGHSDERAFYDVNVFGTQNLLKAAKEASLNLDKLVIASSANVYGSVNDGSIEESRQLAPVNHYATSKAAMEYTVSNWFDTFPIILTRPFNYTGRGQDAKFLVPKIVQHFKDKAQVIELGNLDVSRDFSDVRDVARYYVSLYESEVDSEVVNLCSGQVFSLSYILEEMSSIAGYPIDVKVNPDFVRNNEIKVLGGSREKLHKLTGITPKYSFRETLEHMYSELEAS